MNLYGFDYIGVRTFQSGGKLEGMAGEVNRLEVYHVHRWEEHSGGEAHSWNRE